MRVTRKELELILIQSLADRVSVTPDQLTSIKDFKLSPVIKNNKVVGCFLNKENEIHIAILKEYRLKWFSKKVFKELINDLLLKYGYLKTKVAKDNDKGLRFITKLGFIRKGDWYVYTPNRYFS